MSFNFFFHVGKYFQMLGKLFTKPERFRMYWRETMRQMNDIGVDSMLIIGIVSVFIGMVTAVQFAYQIFGTSLIPGYYLGVVVRDTAILELSPTISCLILAGKVGSNIASELGSMRSQEQIDALEIMGVNTEAYLIGPRVVASVIVVPMLVVLSATLAIVGGYVALGISSYVTVAEYEQGLLLWFKPFNVEMMLIKAVVFAFIIASVSAYQGFYVKGGSVEIGRSSTRAVVYSCILILFADYVIAVLLL
jgi:phospholipid/cholesterol/gamma-HCH transport system permease protein